MPLSPEILSFHENDETKAKLSVEEIKRHVYVVHEGGAVAVKARSPEELVAYAHELEDLPEYKAYKSQRISLETFDGILNRVEGGGDGGNDDERNKFLEQLRKVYTDIKKSIQQYYDVILEQQTYKIKSQDSENIKNYQSEVESLDRRRRQIHNVLMDNLRIFTRLCNTKGKQLGIEISENELFGYLDLQDDNRSVIGSWAFNTEQGRRIQEVIDIDRKEAGLE